MTAKKENKTPTSVGATAAQGIRTGRENALSSRLKAAVIAIKKSGVDSFVLGLADGELVTTHMEKIPSRRASQIAIALFNQVLQSEIDSPALTKEQKEVFAELQLRFRTMLQEHNARMGQLAQPE